MDGQDFEISESLVAGLLRRQFPQWAGLSITPVSSSGTDNMNYRLGDVLIARLPRKPASVPSLEKEQTWLPFLRDQLPLNIPQIVACGKPSPEFPAPWSVCCWIEGDTFREHAGFDWQAFVQALAAFIQALQNISTEGAPPPGLHNFGRGAPLASRNKRVLAALDATARTVDVDAARRAWESDSSAPLWNGPPRWLHGDLHAQNILLAQGCLHAVIDFGGLGVGDPACELAVAWRLLPAHARSPFRELLAPDLATWSRARAWALSISLMEVQHYHSTNPVLTAIALRTIEQVLSDRGG